MAASGPDAFEAARLSGEVELYLDSLGTDAPPEAYLQVAEHFESEAQYDKAATAYCLCHQYRKALTLLLGCGEAGIKQAIEVVGKAKDDALTHQLIDFLMADTNGKPLPPSHICSAYVELAQGGRQCHRRPALVVSRLERELGNYRAAHEVLSTAVSEWAAGGLKVPRAARQALLLLHSYLLVVPLVKMKQHEAAARLLVRVAEQLSQFPRHAVPILTSTVIECQRARMKASACKYAEQLFTPQHRPLVEPRFKHKLEALVRKQSSEEAKEELTPCPFCSHMLPATCLHCPGCARELPYCIVSGAHMTLAEWSCCAACRFPALRCRLKAFAAAHSQCPMCGEALEEMSVDPASHLADIVKGWAVDEEAKASSLSSTGSAKGDGDGRAEGEAVGRGAGAGEPSAE